MFNAHRENERLAVSGGIFFVTLHDKFIASFVAGDCFFEIFGQTVEFLNAFQSFTSEIFAVFDLGFVRIKFRTRKNFLLNQFSQTDFVNHAEHVERVRVVEKLPVSYAVGKNFRQKRLFRLKGARGVAVNPMILRLRTLLLMCSMTRL